MHYSIEEGWLIDLALKYEKATVESWPSTHISNCHERTPIGYLDLEIALNSLSEDGEGMPLMVLMPHISETLWFNNHTQLEIGSLEVVGPVVEVDCM